MHESPMSCQPSVYTIEIFAHSRGIIHAQVVRKDADVLLILDVLFKVNLILMAHARIDVHVCKRVRVLTHNDSTSIKHMHTPSEHRRKILQLIRERTPAHTY